MAKTLVNYSLGGPGTPQEVEDLRQSSFDLHDELGFPVVHKHRWNQIDLREGRARLCPVHDDLYQKAPQNCAYCFGTNFVGGFGDGSIVFVTLQDSAQDVIRILEGGTLQMDQHPQLTAPWLPLMGDGDLVILADFEGRNWNVSDTNERYVLQDVNPISMRGPGWGRQRSTTLSRFRISQQAQVDRLPYGHPLYEVPITFDYNTVPSDIIPPDEADPLVVGIHTEHIAAVRIRGAEIVGFTSDHSQSVSVAVAGEPTSTSQGIRIHGQAGGTVINF